MTNDGAFDVPALRDACRALSCGSSTDQERGIGIQAWLDAAEARIESIRRRIVAGEDFAAVVKTDRMLKTLLAEVDERGALGVGLAVEAEPGDEQDHGEDDEGDEHAPLPDVLDAAGELVQSRLRTPASGKESAARCRKSWRAGR